MGEQKLKEMLETNKYELITNYEKRAKEHEWNEVFLKYSSKFLEIIKEENIQLLKDIIEKLAILPPYKSVKISQIQESFLEFKKIIHDYIKNKYEEIERKNNLTTLNSIVDNLIFKAADFYLETSNANLIKQKSILERKVQEMSTLLSISLAMNETVELKKLLQFIADEILSLVNFYSFSIMLLTPKGELEINMISGYRKNQPKKIVFKKGEGVAGWVAENKRPLYIPDTTRDKRFINLDEKVKSIFSIPLFSGRKFIGVLNIDGNKVDAFPIDKRSLVEIFSSQAAVAIANACRYKTTKESNNIDPITHIFNNTYFDEFFEHEIKKEGEKEIPFSLFILNMDNFHRITNQFGSIQKNKILKEIGELLEKSIRKIDCIARLGEDEFGIILIGVDIKEAKKEVVKIKKLIEDHEWNIKAKKLTCSIGYTVYPVHGREREELISKARVAMVFAKKNGKNKICSYSSQMDKD